MTDKTHEREDQQLTKRVFKRSCRMAKKCSTFPMPPGKIRTFNHTILRPRVYVSQPVPDPRIDLRLRVLVLEFVSARKEQVHGIYHSYIHGRGRGGG